MMLAALYTVLIAVILWPVLRDSYRHRKLVKRLRQLTDHYHGT